MCMHALLKCRSAECANEYFAADSDDGLCCLCDKPVSAKLVPCGHTLMCRTCVGEARRCPKCFVSQCFCVSSRQCRFASSLPPGKNHWIHLLVLVAFILVL